MNPILRKIINFFVPTPQTVRRHRAPSARFVTLAALAATKGNTLTRDGRSYTLCTSDMRVFEFDNLAQVKSFLDLKDSLDKANRIDGGGRMEPGPATDVGGCGKFVPAMVTPAVAQGAYDIGPSGMSGPHPIVPFVPVLAVPITNDIVRE